MDGTVIVSVGALLISFWLAFLQWRKYRKDKKLAEKADMIQDFKAPAERDSIIVASAKEAVVTLTETVRLQQEELRELKKRTTHLERELARCIHEGKAHA